MIGTWKRSRLVLAWIVVVPLVGVLSASQASAVSSNQFAWPATGVVPANDVAWHQTHQSGSRAVDIQAGQGTEVGAAQSGVVTVAFTGCANSGSPECGRGFGNHVVIRHDRTGVGAPLYTLYGHLNSALNVSAGAVVTIGQRLGAVAMSGNTDGPHVHFAISTCSSTWWGATCTIWNAPDTTAATVVTGTAMPGTYAQLGTEPPGSGGVGNSTYRGSELTHGQWLSQNEYLASADVRFALILQNDGNLVLYGPGFVALWSSGTAGSGATRLLMQDDGNLVLYKPIGVAWASGMSGAGTPTLKLQDDGNLVVYRISGPSWATGTGGRPTITQAGTNHLQPGHTLPPNHYLRSSDNRHALLLQGDGNLLLYGPGGHYTWSTATPGRSPIHLVLQGDGNLVLYDATAAYWSTATAGASSNYLVLQDDGNLVLYSPQGALWSTATAGRM